MSTNVVEIAIRATDQASSAFNSAGGSLGKYVGLAAAGVAASAGLVLGTAKLIQVMNEQANAAKHAADRLGTTVEQVTALQGAAMLADIPIESLEKSLGLMNKNLSIAAETGGALSKSLAQVGLSAITLNNMPFEQKLAAVADMLQRIENPADKARIAMEVFGRSGQQMLQLLGEGSGGLKKLTDDVERLGYVMSEQAAHNADQLGDAFDRVGLATTGVRNSMMEQLAPLLTGVLNEFAYWIADNKQAITEWADSAITNTMAAFILMRRVFTELFVILGDFWGYVTQGADGFWENALAIVTFLPRQITALLVWLATNFAKFAGWLSGLFINVVGSIASLFAAGFQTAFAYIVDMAIILGKRILDALQGNVVKPLGTQMTEAWARAMGDWESRSHSTFQAIQQWSGEAWTDVKNTGSAALNSVGGVIDYLKEKAKELGDAFDWESALKQVEAIRAQADAAMGTPKARDEEGGGSDEEGMSFYAKWAEQAEAFKKSHGTMVEELATSTFDLMMNTAGAIGDVFATSIMQGKGLGKALEGLAKQVLQQLLSMLIRIGIQRLILSKISKVSTVSENAVNLGAAAAQVFANSFASAAAIPIIGWAMAPGVAAANLATATAGMTGAFAAGAATGAGTAGAMAAAHGGLDYVPAEQTYKLQRGERVVSPKQNEDLTSFLEGGGMSGSGTTVTINVEEDGLYSDRTIRKLADALNRVVSKHGVRLVVNERSSKRP